jgi:hypothetical protein
LSPGAPQKTSLPLSLARLATFVAFIIAYINVEREREMELQLYRKVAFKVPQGFGLRIGEFQV